MAIKVMRPELAISPDRFLREILIVAGLQHPNIVPLFDSGQAGGLLYYVMPLVKGESLRKHLQAKRQLPLAEAIGIALEVADALSYAHSRGLVHRDVKPENILLSEGHAVLSDFGVARAIERSVDSLSTGPGVAIGTPAYMSPEQASADPVIDARSDQYSLACVVYEMLTGDAPYGTGTPQTVLRASVKGEFPDPRTKRSDLPASIAPAVRRALAPDPHARFESVNAFADALVGDTGLAHRSGPRARLARLAEHGALTSRIRMAWLVGAAALVGVAGVALANWIREPSPVSSARAQLDPRRIAVLYFDDHSPDRNLEYLASGLTESLIHELSGVGAIQVISRNGVKPFRGAAVPLDSIVRTLRVGSVVEGSVQRSGNRIRLTVQLIDARTDAHLESSTLERDLGELFLLQDDLARRVSDLLRRRIGAEVRLRTVALATRSARARELMYRADRARDEADRLAVNRDTGDVRRAIARGRSADSLLALAEQADRRWSEPVVARGWVALEIARRSAGRERVVAFDSATAHANRALARDSASPAALELRGTTAYYRAVRLTNSDPAFRDALLRSQADLERAVARDSALARAWGTLSRVHVALGELGAAERTAQTALSMDAYLEDAPEVALSLYVATLMSDSLDASWRWCERGATDFPVDFRFIDCRLTLLAEDDRRRPDPQRALDLLALSRQLDPPARAHATGMPWLPVYRDMMAAIVLARAGAADSARGIARRARVAVGNDPELVVDLKYELALLHLVLGERREAVRLLSEYLDSRPTLRGLVSNHPRWKSLRTDAAFMRLVRP